MPTLTTFSARHARRHLSLTLATVALVAACNPAPAVTPGTSTPPTQPPSGSPTGAPSGAPTPGATPTAAPTPTLPPSPTFGEGQIQHPTGATDIVLRMEQGGGFMPMEANMTQSPQFTLYGDGTVVFKPTPGPDAPFFGGMWEPWLTGRMSEEGIQALLAYALGAGRLANARAMYEDNMCADCSTTWFNLNAAGVEKVVTVHALGEAIPGQGDADDRNGMNALAQLLNSFEAEAQSGTVDGLTTYEPTTYRVTMFDDMGGQPTSEPVDWPWPDLTMDDFPAGDEPGGIRMMSAEDVAQLVDVPNGGAAGLWVNAPDGSLVQFAVRPLLPDEAAAVEGL